MPPAPGSDTGSSWGPEMNRHRRATELFLACCDMPVEEREAYLQENSGDDRELIDQVAGMIAFEERQPDFLGTSAVRSVIGTPGPREVNEPR